MQIPIVNGIYTDEIAEFRTAYPRNLVPVTKDIGLSKGYLRPAEGIVEYQTSPGVDRGGINWQGVCYRIAGSSLIKILANGSYVTLGDVGGSSSQCTLDYSFDRLAVCSDGNFYYWDGTTLTQVTDSDLGTVIDFIWVDGYFMTTDGTYVVVTDITDPFAVSPLKYGSAEIDPDPILAILKLHNEPYALNRYTIQVYENIGGSGFPYQVVNGATITRGTIGTHTAVVFKDAIAFVGSGRDEPPAVWLGVNAQTTKLSTREIDTILQTYSESVLSNAVVETRIDKDHAHLLIHLPDQTLVYDAIASQLLQEPVWFTLDSGGYTKSLYRARNLVWCYDQWLVGDPILGRYGYLANNISTHYGTTIGWEFGTTIIYNESRGAIIHELELVTLPGRVPLGADPTIWTSYSKDGETWSIERSIQAGKQGERNKRLVWFQQGSINSWRVQKFRGTSDAYLSVARLEAQVEALNV